MYLFLVYNELECSPFSSWNCEDTPWMTLSAVITLSNITIILSGKLHSDTNSNSVKKQFSIWPMPPQLFSFMTQPECSSSSFKSWGCNSCQFLLLSMDKFVVRLLRMALHRRFKVHSVWAGDEHENQVTPAQCSHYTSIEDAAIYFYFDFARNKRYKIIACDSACNHGYITIPTYSWLVYVNWHLFFLI